MNLEVLQSGERLAGLADAGFEVLEEVLSSAQIDTVKSCEVTSAKKKLDQHRSNRAWSPRAVRINGWRYAGPIEADTITRSAARLSLLKEKNVRRSLISNYLRGSSPASPQETSVKSARKT